jgi:hypothetical protein
MNTAFKAFLVLCIGVFFTACQKDLSHDQGNIQIDIPTATNITATVAGRITNELGEPVKGAMVTAGSASAMTDVNGIFEISNASLKDQAAFIKVDKAGYFTGSRTFRAKQSQKHYVEIQLLPKTTIGTINASTGGTINVSNGSVITLPANGVVLKSTGAAYTGTVNVAMTWIDPTSASLATQMPGDLRGVDESNRENGLTSYGMLGVELEGAGGEKLQIATGKKAQLKFPLPAAIQGNAPATIALWSFNETTGLWKQEGTATKVGTKYEAEVSHFSFWNCDAPFQLTTFTATLKDQNGNPLKHVLVKIKRMPGSGWFTTGWAFTDSSGVVHGLIPKNEALILEVYTTSNCATPVHSQNIGPFTSPATMNITVNISSASSFTISGTAQNCSGAAVTDGFAEVKMGFQVYRAPIVNGAFSVSFNNCTSTQQVHYFIVDNTGGQQSTPVTTTINAGNTDVGVINACGTSTQQFINFSVDGTPHNLIFPANFMMANSYSQGTTFTTTSVNGGDSLSNTSIYFSFNGSAPGTFPLSFVMAQVPGIGDSLTMKISNPINVTVTEFGSIGGYIAGNFSGTLFTGAVAHSVQCTFRVRRQ